MIRIFFVHQNAIDFCAKQILKYGDNYTECIPNSTNDKWHVQILLKDYCNLTYDEQLGFVGKLPDDWEENEI